MPSLKSTEASIGVTGDGNYNDEDDLSTIRDRRRSESGSTWGADEDEDNEDDMLEGGDFSYSSHMEEIFSEEGGSEDDNEDEEEFVYDGKDAEVPTGGYREQLKDVLDGETDGDSVDEAFNRTFESEKSEHQPDHSLNGSEPPVRGSSVIAMGALL